MGKHSTNKLLQELLSSATPEAYLDDLGIDEDDRPLTQYLDDLLETHHIKRSEVIRSSGVNQTFAYQIFKGERKPGRDTAIMLGFGFGCTLKEMQRILRGANVAQLWPRNARDAIIISCIQRNMTRTQTDDELFRLGYTTLLQKNN